MAISDFKAIRKRIREILDDGNGLTRTVSAGRISGDYYTGIDAFAGISRTLGKPRFAIPFIPYQRHQPRQSEVGSIHIYTVRPIIECEYLLPSGLDTDDNRDDALGDAENDAVIFGQALGWPGNLLQTEAAAPTGLVSAWLEFQNVAPVLQDWEGRRLITRHFYQGHIEVNPATS